MDSIELGQEGGKVQCRHVLVFARVDDPDPAFRKNTDPNPRFFSKMFQIESFLK